MQNWEQIKIAQLPANKKPTTTKKALRSTSQKRNRTTPQAIPLSTAPVTISQAATIQTPTLQPALAQASVQAHKKTTTKSTTTKKPPTAATASQTPNIQPVPAFLAANQAQTRKQAKKTTANQSHHPPQSPVPTSPPEDTWEKAKREGRRLWGQLFLLWFLLLGSIAVYLMVIFPYLVQLTGQMSSDKYTPHTQVIRPQTPMLNAPPYYTTNDTLKLVGYASPGTKVQFIIDGQENSQYLTDVGINGEFNLTLTLHEGDNSIQAYSYDDQDQKSNETKVYYVVLDTQKPEIDLQEPENRQQFVGRDQQTIVVKGQTEAKAKVVVNNVAGTADEEGMFAINYRLNDGENRLEIVASDMANNQDKTTITVTYQP